MNVRRKAASATALGALTIAGAVLAPQAAFAHGDMGSPAGRAYTCYLEGAETPKSEGCKGVVAENGAASIYDWMSNRIGDANGRHKELIPDGKLCSANNPTNSGFDRPATAWPTTQLNTGDLPLHFKATAKHQGYFDVYITKDGWDPSKPLAWNDLETQPIAHVENPQETGDGYELPARIPAGKSGQHVLYTIWQRTDSPEAFYSCSDVVFGQQGTSRTAQLQTGKPEAVTVTSHDHDAHHADQPAAPDFWGKVLSLFG
ncbi:lytic polysaccharide monooxygenase auxiliary activity family 9 protein [Saccharopolyspora rosea]|uniref:lytic polysaccharide monooxygenase auxiliary activity family 9 protein n=1 Tax=Saccharopolyspora rosea TaxID=524884 RepID=UPI0021D9E027|nr:lytic polysaccharide monooxygenase [Saccharopolyspora rosea]